MGLTGGYGLVAGTAMPPLLLEDEPPELAAYLGALGGRLTRATRGSDAPA